MTDDPVIRIRGLTTRFGPQVIHDGLDLDVRRGEVLGVVGGSGTGKSVLLKAIVGLLRPAAGTIEVFGEDLRAADDATRAALQQRWGVLFQDGALFGSLNVRQNIQVPLREHLALSQRLMDEIAMLKIDLVGLPPEAEAKLPAELSGAVGEGTGVTLHGARLAHFAEAANKVRPLVHDRGEQSRLRGKVGVEPSAGESCAGHDPVDAHASIAVAAKQSPRRLQR